MPRNQPSQSYMSINNTRPLFPSWHSMFWGVRDYFKSQIHNLRAPVLICCFQNIIHASLLKRILIMLIWCLWKESQLIIGYLDVPISMAMVRYSPPEKIVFVLNHKPLNQIKTQSWNYYPVSLSWKLRLCQMLCFVLFVSE